MSLDDAILDSHQAARTRMRARVREEFHIRFHRNVTSHDIVAVCDIVTKALGDVCAPLDRCEGGIRIGDDVDVNKCTRTRTIRFDTKFILDSHPAWGKHGPICGVGTATLEAWRVNLPFDMYGGDADMVVISSSTGYAPYLKRREVKLFSKAFQSLGFQVIFKNVHMDMPHT